MRMFRGVLVTYILAGILSGVVPTAVASLASAPAEVAQTDQEAGARIAYGRHLASECTSCHRTDTAGNAIPSLAGRTEADIIALLADFREGRKTNAVMVSVARSLDPEETAAVAAYFASLPLPDHP